jgi:hypothetical protein
VLKHTKVPSEVLTRLHSSAHFTFIWVIQLHLTNASRAIPFAEGHAHIGNVTADSQYAQAEFIVAGSTLSG